MTRTPAGYREVVRRFQLNVDKAEADALRFDAVAQKCALMEDTLVGDVYAEAANNALRTADWWRDKAARFEAYAVDAELPATLTVINGEAS